MVSLAQCSGAVLHCLLQPATRTGAWGASPKSPALYPKDSQNARLRPTVGAPMTTLAELLTPSDDGAFHCAACQWRCALRPGETGRCHVRVATDEGIELLNYGLISGAAIGPVEDHRLWHFFPDSLML